MATADQVKALVRSHAEGDDNHFYAVAMQMAAHAAKSGQTKFAQELRDVVDAAKTSSDRARAHKVRPVPVVQPRGDLAGLLAVSYPDAHLGDLVVSPGVGDILRRVLTEQRQQDRLREYGFAPLHSLLLIGPPGTGKTLSASVLAGELHLPLFQIRLDAVITKYMGETAAKLRLIFDAVEETRGLYLFDEVDALAGDRSSTNDVGEIRRVLSSFLQFLEQDHSSSLIIAASNHPRLLDRAVFRRFGAVVEYSLPTPEMARSVIRNRLASIDTKGLTWKRVDDAALGLSHAELTLACEQAAKQALLAKTTRVTTMELVNALNERQRANTGPQ
jgi:SpoVK/Ycf46/Vps4 family AAA+-type ATPase